MPSLVSILPRPEGSSRGPLPGDDQTSCHSRTRSHAMRRHTLKQLARNLLVATIILFTGGMSTMVHTQEPSPAAFDAGVNQAPSRAQQLMGDIAPKLAELTDKVLFGDVWERPQLSKRDRSLITVAALIAMNRPDQLRSHLARARDNGVTQEEV